MTDQPIHAFTEPGADLPPFINATRLSDGSVRVLVRSPKAGTPSEIVMSESDWRSFAWSAFAETNDREKAVGRPGACVPASEEQIKHMVSRFLAWKLPEHFRPDAGISFKREFNEHTAHPMKHEPFGTNLFDATQADAMVRHMLDGLPQDSSTSTEV